MNISSDIPIRTEFIYIGNREVFFSPFMDTNCHWEDDDLAEYTARSNALNNLRVDWFSKTRRLASLYAIEDYDELDRQLAADITLGVKEFDH